MGCFSSCFILFLVFISKGRFIYSNQPLRFTRLVVMFPRHAIHAIARFLFASFFEVLPAFVPTRPEEAK